MFKITVKTPNDHKHQNKSSKECNPPKNCCNYTLARSIYLFISDFSIQFVFITHTPVTPPDQTMSPLIRRKHSQDVFLDKQTR